MLLYKDLNDAALTFIDGILVNELSEVSSFFSPALGLLELKLFSHLTWLSPTTVILIADVTRQALLSYLGRQNGIGRLANVEFAWPV